jgi:hypothetical protein
MDHTMQFIGIPNTYTAIFFITPSIPKNMMFWDFSDKLVERNDPSTPILLQMISLKGGCRMVKFPTQRTQRSVRGNQK